jgi:hypothetical protein
MFLPLELTLRPSRVYRLVMTLVHGLALLGVWLAALPVWTQAAMTLGLLLSVIWAWREISSGPRGLRVSQSGQVELFDGEWRAAQIKGRPVVLPWLVSLTLMPEAGKTRQLMIWADSAEAELLRKLRVWLRWGNQPPA